MPEPLMQLLHQLGLRKMTSTEFILFREEGVRHYFDPAPETLIYHYTSAGGALGILNSNHIWLSEFEKTNDASEFLFAKARFSEAIEPLRSKYSEALISAYFDCLRAFENGMGMLIGSFTESADDVAQWERYADKSAGCVLGFDARWFYRYPGVRLHRIIYDRDYLNDLVEANLYILRQVSKRTTLDMNSVGSVFPSLFVFEKFAFKDPRFRSEAEIRLSRSVLRRPDEATGLLDDGLSKYGRTFEGPFAQAFEIKQREGAYGPTRYIELPITYDGTSALRSVGIGPKCSPEDEAKIRAALSSNPRVKVWKSDIPLR